MRFTKEKGPSKSAFAELLESISSQSIFFNQKLSSTNNTRAFIFEDGREGDASFFSISFRQSPAAFKIVCRQQMLNVHKTLPPFSKLPPYVPSLSSIKRNERGAIFVTQVWNRLYRREFVHMKRASPPFFVFRDGCRSTACEWECTGWNNLAGKPA